MIGMHADDIVSERRTPGRNALTVASALSLGAPSSWPSIFLGWKCHPVRAVASGKWPPQAGASAGTAMSASGASKTARNPREMAMGGTVR